MSKFFKLLAVLFLSICFFVSCGDSKNNNGGKEGKEEYEGDGTEEFVTVESSSQEKGEANGGSYDDEVEADADDAEAAPGDEGGSAEREIVESDIYKFDGNVLWLANQYKGLIAVDIKDPENLKILGTLRFKGYVGEMYLQEGRAYILVSYTDEHYDAGEIYYYNRTSSKLMVVNTEDPENLELLGEFEMDGWITDSRQVGDVIYVASTEYRYYWSGCDGDSGTSGADQISLMSVNIKDPKNIKMVDKIALDGYSYTLYVSQKSIYVAEADTYYWDEDYTEGYPVTMFDISDPEGKIVKKAEFKTDGFMSDRWKMHETGNTFFAVSSSSSWGNGDSFIESFDISDPKNVKKLDKLVFMTDQQLYGTKFEGDRMYAVTYFQQDPLHVIDISDPANLKQLGELEVPGWSTHLEVRGTKILAAGRDGNTSKISLYDVADPENPKEINTVEVGSGYSYSEAEYDWKAFKIFDELGLILYPVTDYGDDWTSRYKLYLVDFDLDKGLKTRGYIASDSYVRRGVAIQDLIFSIGESHLVTADASDRDNPKILSELTLAAYVNGVTNCGKALCGFDNDHLNFNAYDKNTGETIWTTKTLPGESFYAEVNLTKNSNFAYIHRLLYNSKTDEMEPSIKVIKFSDDGKFEEVGDFSAGKEELTYILNASENNVIASVIENRDWYEDHSGSRMRMRLFNMNKPGNGIKTTDFDFDYDFLDNGRKIFALKDSFWSSGCKLKKEDPENGDQYLCYALSYDAGNPSSPKENQRVNIPGEIVGISKDAKYLYTQTPTIYDYENGEDYTSSNDDYYWSSSGTSDFYILKLNDSKTAVKVVKKETLTNSYGYSDGKYESVASNVYAKNDKVFFVKILTGEEWNTCSYRTSGTTEVRVISAADGRELYKKSFDNAKSILNVNDGGLLVPTTDGWTYIAPDGKEKSGSDDISSANSYSYYGYRDGYVAEPQLIDGKIYIAAGWDGIYSLNVK